MVERLFKFAGAPISSSEGAQSPSVISLMLSLRVGMHNYGIKQPVVCCIMRGQDSTLTGLLPLESFGSLIRILNLLISTDSSSVVSYLNR